MQYLTVPDFAYPSSLLAVLFAVLITPSVSFARDGSQTVAWVQEVSDKYLEYHCRIRFGDDPTKFKFNGNLNEQRWNEIEKILNRVDTNLSSPWNEIDNNLINLYRMRREFEQLVQQKERELSDQLGFLAIRAIAEEMGGDDVKQLYGAMPDDWNIKQDIPGVATEWIKAGWTVQQFNQALLKLERDVETTIKSKAGSHAKQILEQLNRIENMETVSIYEKQWLTENRPAMLDRLNIEAGAKLRDLHTKLESMVLPDRLKTMRKHGRSSTKRFLFHWDQSQTYEKQGLLSLAASELEMASKLFWPAFEDAKLGQAENANPNSAWFETIQALGQSTIRKIKPDRYKKTELVVIDPLDSKILPKQIEAADGRLGFLGGIELPMVPTELELIAGGTKAVLLTNTGLMTYSLETGKREHLMFDLPSGVQLAQMKIPAGEKVAYVVSSEPSILRYDLNSGKRDSGFAEIPVLRRDTKIALTPDGKMIATGLFGKINFYETKSGKHLGETSGLTNSLIYGLEFSPNGKMLYVHGNNPRIKYVDVSGKKTGERRIVEKGNVYVYRLVNRTDGIQIACGRNALTAWQGKSDKPVFHVEFSDESRTKVEWADVTPDKKHIVSSHGIWNFQSGELVIRMHPNWNPKAMAMSPDGQRLVLCRGKGLFVTPLALTHPDEMTASIPAAASNETTDSSKKSIIGKAKDDPEAKLTTQPKTKAAVAREWVDESGKYKFRAKLVGRTNDTVKLEASDGSIVEVLISKLSTRDQRYLKKN